jgi:hypothetical protein
VRYRALDSGGFTELSMHGRWITTASQYAEAVATYADRIGGLDFAAPMDWMCEPFMTELTGLTVREHQDRTVAFTDLLSALILVRSCGRTPRPGTIYLPARTLSLCLGG